VLPERRRALIAGLLVFLIGVAAWSYFAGMGGATTPAQTAATSGGAARRQPPPKSAESLPAAEAVRLPSLDQSREEPSSATRNPFKFQRPAAAPAKAPEEAQLFKPGPAPDAAPAGPPPPPPIPLKFIGVLEQSDGAKWAVLSVGDGRAPLHGKEGDIIDGRYRILKIGTESIEMAYLDGRGRQTIRLTGQ
jgi:hypothetical protein